MSELSTLLIKRGGEVIDTYSDFGFATGEIDFPAVVEIKEPYTKDCHGEDGERVFFPKGGNLKAYDLHVEFKHKGNIEIYHTSNYRAFRNFMTGYYNETTELSIYSPWHRIGRQKVYLKSLSDGEFRRDGDQVYLILKAVFRVTDPRTDILITK